MHLRQLGKNGPIISTIGLGCMGMSMGYGSQSNDNESINIIHHAIASGITHFDTADIYGWGHNEELIGKAIKTYRHQLTLATKMGFVKGGGADALDFHQDASPAYIKKACDLSLKRLNTDTIDLYYLHRVDPKTPIEDSISAMADLVQSGKIRYIGISEVKPSTIRRAAKIHPITAVQTEYSLWERSPEHEILPTCEELGIGFVAYSPLGRGFLTGTLSVAAEFSQEDFRSALPRFQGDNYLANQQLLVGLNEISEKKGCSMAQLVLAWTIARYKNIVAIPGMRKIEHLNTNLNALTIELSKKELKQLENLFPINIAKGAKYPDTFQCEG